MGASVVDIHSVTLPGGHRLRIKEADVVDTTYEYKFVTIELKTGFGMIKPKQDYHEIIQHSATEGWRLVQIFAPGTSDYGLASYFELIFEKPCEQADSPGQHPEMAV